MMPALALEGHATGAPRIPPALARRIDRLARRAHAFHRFAHHPLCSAYAPEVIPLGHRLRLCRGCALVAAGGAVGAVLALLVPPPSPLALVAGLAALALLAVPAVRPRSASLAAGAAGKLATRALPMALCAVLVVLGLRAGSAAGLSAVLLASANFGLALAATAIFATALLVYRRRGPDRSACLGCPEAPASVRCSGFAPLARRERAFRRLAARWLADGPGRRGSAEGDEPRPAGALAGVRQPPFS